NGTTVNGKSPSEYFWMETIKNQIKRYIKVDVSRTVTPVRNEGAGSVTEVLQQSDDGEFLSISWRCHTSPPFFPFFGLAILFIIACLEEGSWQGIKYLFQPDLEKLKDITVWNEATVQAFFSLNVAYGSILMVASYSKFHTSMHRDTMIICVLVMVTNLLAGCVTFAMLGSLAYKYSKDVHEVLNHEGLGLAFIVYPEALATISYVRNYGLFYFSSCFTFLELAVQ
ncbi:sodium- and chloride-dependent glycine transporter 2, partial [Caerostris extrusa]